MPESGAVFELSVADGSLRISGSETFISVHLKELNPIIEQLFATYGRGNPSGSLHAARQETSATPAADSPNSVGLDAYANVFAYESDQLKIIKAVSGGSVAEKAKAVAYLYLYGKHLLGQEPTKGDELRDALKEHGCLDSPNFAKSMKADKENIIVIQPTPKTLLFKLSVPGKERAKALVTSLNS